MWPENEKKVTAKRRIQLILASCGCLGTTTSAEQEAAYEMGAELVFHKQKKIQAQPEVEITLEPVGAAVSE